MASDHGGLTEGLPTPHERTLDVVERLQRLMKQSAGEQPQRPDTLPLAAIRTAPGLFQAREGNAKEGDVDAGHVQALVRALEAKPSSARTLDPVTVFAVGGDAYCIDGHHRLGAYRAFKVTPSIPVEWFQGSLEEAITEAIERNQKAKLPMKPMERMEGAWTLVLMGAHSKARIATTAGVSERTVANMRSLLRSYREKFPAERPGKFQEVRNEMADRMPTGFSDEMKEAMIERFRSTIAEKFGRQAAKHNGLFAEALLRYGGQSFVTMLADYWGFIPEDDPECDF
ncbi:hypothetical protein FJ527_01050 [Mesorhizobium sp. B2-4-18]|uniref:hypothetical protein n=1 Tax=Mesorhizobium sp. B2-4-18 TaxID=2589931 RepID=UPI00112B5942|nr:hypothetical protein [Mesorhizobium sp. B2-4-18]TPK80394.1 hypothetical protein FJ527_01050 [Mesorhizobium sp. B2-4-18]